MLVIEAPGRKVHQAGPSGHFPPVPSVPSSLRPLLPCVKCEPDASPPTPPSGNPVPSATGTSFPLVQRPPRPPDTLFPLRYLRQHVPTTHLTPPPPTGTLPNVAIPLPLGVPHMKKPSVDASTGSFLKKSTYTRARLSANPQAKKLVALLDPQHRRLKKSQSVVNDAEDDEIMKEADVDEVAGQAGAALGALNLDLTSFVSRDYKDPLFKHVFPAGLAGLRELSAASLQPEVVRICAILKSLGPSHKLAPHAKVLAGIELAWRKPFEAHAEATNAVILAQGTHAQDRKDWLDAYAAVYGALQQLFPRRDSFIEGFFRREHAAKVAKKSPAPVDQAPAGPNGKQPALA